MIPPYACKAAATVPGVFTLLLMLYYFKDMIEVIRFKHIVNICKLNFRNEGIFFLWARSLAFEPIEHIRV